jgi:excisionase family DNA binding protein
VLKLGIQENYILMSKPQAQDKPFAEAVSNSASSQAAELNSAAILTKQQAGELLGCTVRYIERQIHAGRLRACKPTGKFVRIFRRDIDAFLLSGASIA